jgi:hypothetical protein
MENILKEERALFNKGFDAANPIGMKITVESKK